MANLLHTLYIRIIVAAACIVAGAGAARAFDTAVYADRSVLADGRWVRIAVERSGPVLLSAADLRRMGFSDISAVRVYGYGGVRIPDILSIGNYTDDLPQAASEVTARGLVFYAQGPETYSYEGERAVHSLNPFSSYGYYFISDSGDTPRREPIAEGLDAVSGAGATTFTATTWHELEEASLGESGHRLFGEDMRYTRSRTLTIPMPGRVEDTEVWVRTTFGSSLGYDGTLAVAINGEADPSPTRIMANSGHNYGVVTTSTRTVNPSGASLALGITFDTRGTASAARIDAIDVNYTRELTLPASGVLAFTLRSSEVTLSCGDAAAVRVWDVTDPLSVSAMCLTPSADGKSVSWRSPYGGRRSYVAWTADATGFTPVVASEPVANQNLHGALAGDALPDMVIIAPRAFAVQAERIAAMHRDDAVEPLAVTVVTAEQAYNEFGSGAADVNALRRLLKMVYDRGAEAGRPLRFALLLGRATYDNRRLTQEMRALGQMTLPTWQTDESLSLYDSYCSDDILAMLADGAGSRLASDAYSIAVGRIPAGTVATLASYIDKLAAYSRLADDRGWKNRALFVADDGNLGRHMEQSESMAAAMLATDGGSRLDITKAYVDAFDLVGGEATGARERQMRALDDGIVWWNYIGHASINTLTSERMLSLTDIGNLYLRRQPFFYGATCSFARWDGSETSGLELLALNGKGGVIAGISATREVFIEQNGQLSDAIGAEAFRRRDNGLLPTIGELYQAAKNRLASPGGTSNSNKLRYVLLGDPAMRLATPSANVEVTSIGGIAADGSAEEPPVIMARQRVTIAGRVTDGSGRPLDSFNGIVGATLYDAEYSTTSKGRKTPADGEGKQVTFEETGSRLYAGRDSVASGRFSLSIAMPDQVADNWRPATISLYAVGDDGTEATGTNRNFYVYGYDDSAERDLTPPVIEYAFLNHQSFIDGDAVNPSPMFIARVTDNEGINLSTAGVGRHMSLTVDGTVTYDDVARYFTPVADGSNGGTVAYPLSDLAEGHHELIFRVYDTSGNAARATLAFAVAEGLAPKLFEVYTDANPARIEANFYLRHDRPDATLTVTVEMFDLLGHMVWTSKATDRSDMFTSAPIKWDLRDMGGRRVQRGIYIYRVTASEASGAPRTISGRIAVAAD